MSTAVTRGGVWWTGARPRTLGAASVPVAVGAAAASYVSAWRTAAALTVALGLQVGVNYANDYFDGVRGIDTEARVGPLRLTASGTASPRAVATAAAVAVAVAMAAGVALALAVQPLLLAIGAAAVLATVLYSGGPRPYAARGLGEIAVLVFFGPVAVCGTCYVESGAASTAAWWASIPVGLLCVGILVVNNLRDIPTDAATGKRTLAVRLGDPRTRVLYGGLVAAAFLVPLVGVLSGGLPRPALLVLLALPLAAAPLHLVRGAHGRELVPALVTTARLHLAAGALLAAGLAIR